MSQLTMLNTPINRRRLLVFSAAGALALSPVVRRAAFAAVESSVTTNDYGTYFDPAVIHEFALDFEQAAYDAMAATFKEQGKKEWMEATVTIDGVAYPKTGIRLKGNSSLGGLIMSGDAAGTEPLPEATPSDQGFGTTEEEEGREGVNFENPQILPWYVRLDKYVKKQSHQGVTDFAIRSNISKSMLNEVTSLDLLFEAGLASQRAAYGQLTVNGGDPVLRLTVEIPNDAWMAAHFSADGILFKCDADGTWDYLGDQTDLYFESFDLEAGGTGDDAVDFEVIPPWLDFVNNSDDATFVSELPAKLDISKFATYRAMMKLIQNDDDITGPGNNSYLYFAPETDQVTIVPWDMNLSFAQAAFANMEGRGGPVFQIAPGTNPPDGTPVAGDGRVVINGDGEILSGTPQAGEIPAGAIRGHMNPFVSRFEEVEEFAAMIEAAIADWKATLFSSGRAEVILDTWVTLLQTNAGALLDAETLKSEADAMRTAIKES